MEYEEELVMEMEEVGKHSREPLKMTDKMEIGQLPTHVEGRYDTRQESQSAPCSFTFEIF